MEVKRAYNVFIRYLGLTVQNHYPVTMAIHAKLSHCRTPLSFSPKGTSIDYVILRHNYELLIIINHKLSYIYFPPLNMYINVGRRKVSQVPRSSQAEYSPIH